MWVPAFPTDQVRGLKAHGTAAHAPFYPLWVCDSGGGLGRDQWAVIVAVVAMRVMKMAGDVIIDVVAVRDRLVPAAWAVHMTRRMTTAAMVGGAAVGVLV
jgi:hypothetical protein